MRIHKIYSTLLPALLLPAVAIAAEPPATSGGAGECTMLTQVAVGDAVKPGARLLTGKDSHAEIRYKDSCVVPVPVDSLFVYQATSPCQVNGKPGSAGSAAPADGSVISAVTGEVKMSVCFNPAQTGGVAGGGAGFLGGLGTPALIGIGVGAGVGLGLGLGLTVGSDNGGGPTFNPGLDPSRAIP